MPLKILQSFGAMEILFIFVMKMSKNTIYTIWWWQMEEHLAISRGM